MPGLKKYPDVKIRCRNSCHTILDTKLTSLYARADVNQKSPPDLYGLVYTLEQPLASIELCATVISQYTTASIEQPLRAGESWEPKMYF